MAALGGASFRAEVRDLVLLSSSPRSGSSMLAGALRAVPGLLHLQGEVTPFLTRAGLAFPESGTGSDVLTARHADGPAADRLAGELAAETGHPTELRGPADLDAFAAFVADRLAMQWPALAEHRDRATALARALAAEIPLDSEQAVSRNLQRFWVRLLLRVREFAPYLNPAYYDLQPAVLRRWFADVPTPDGPPGHRLVEVPPYVLAQPWRAATAAELAAGPLVIKTPGNAYRFAFWRAFFPNARIRILHLHRHPVAVIESLARAWSYRGFFAHHLPGRLRIEGYTDQHGDWARSWWNFDLPPGWEEFTRDSLENLCAFQWRAANETILRFTDTEPVESLRMSYDAFTGGRDRVRAFGQVLDWLGLPSGPLAGAVFPREMVAYETTSATDPGRLKVALDEPGLRRVADRLGYQVGR